MSYIKLVLEALEAQDMNLLETIHSIMETNNARKRRSNSNQVRTRIAGLLALSSHGRNSVSKVSNEDSSAKQGQTGLNGIASDGLLDSDRSQGCEPLEERERSVLQGNQSGAKDVAE